MLVLEYILLAVLLVTALFLIVAVTLQKTSEDGLSGTIVGGSETYYGKDKAMSKDKKLYRGTIVAGVIFILAVVVVYVIQPDFAASAANLDAWQKASEFASIFQ